ncbi:MAG: hypothetical protein AAF577_04230 [Pseudomonadota bacterium]
MQKRRFISADEGAVTVDWVALAAGLMILSAGLVGLFTTEVQAVVDEIEEQIVLAGSFDPGFLNSDPSAGGGGNGLLEGATYETGAEGWTAGPGDYWADFNGDGVPNQGDLFLIDGNNDGDFTDGVDAEIDGVGSSAGEANVVQVDGLDVASGTYTDSDKGQFTSDGSDTFAVVQLQ